jgi:pimeloyl-ACP methyl ester carboxylesterase
VPAIERPSVPDGFALFPADISHPPREWAEGFVNVQRWTDMPSGGHFAAMEEPEALAEDIRAFLSLIEPSDHSIRDVQG